MRNIWWTGAVAVAIVLLAVGQAASTALFGSLGRTPSFARAFASDWPFDAARATGLDRFGPVRVELARAALLRDDAARAGELLDGLPATPAVDDLRGQVALARGQVDLAVSLFGAAGDVVHAESTIDAVAARDPLAAYTLAAAFARDAVRRDEPLPVRGDAAWRAGQRAATVAYARPAEAARYNAIALADYRDAVNDDPTQEAYLLAEGLGALAMGDVAASLEAYRRSVQVVPDSVDGFVGLAAASARSGDCAGANQALASARAYALRQHRAADPAAAGYDAPTRAALARCTAPA